MARRATFVRNNRVDTVATVTVESGNFAALANDEEFSKRRELVVSFFENEHYDAVTLGSQELNSPLSLWQDSRDNGLPIIAANLFDGPRSKKPIFEPYRWFERAGVRMTVVGLVMERALKDCPDSASVRVDSPFKMQKFMKKVMKRTDHLTLIGDFTIQEADSLARTYPFTDVIVSSNSAVATTHVTGKTVISACGSKGYYGEYVQTEIDESKNDSLKYNTVRETLDTKIPADTVYENRVKESGIHPRK